MIHTSSVVSPLKTIQVIFFMVHFHFSTRFAHNLCTDILYAGWIPNLSGKLR